MNNRLPYLFAVICSIWLALWRTAAAHDEPTSFVELHLNAVGMSTEVTASVTDLAHDLADLEPDMLLRSEIIAARRKEIAAAITSRLKIQDGERELTLNLLEIHAVPAKRDLKVVFESRWSSAPPELRVEGLLFPYDHRHKTFVNVYSGDTVLRQEVLLSGTPAVKFDTSRQQDLTAVVVEFVRQGIHHIFIGPDHILFVAGLMLLGGNLGQLLKIVTCFTIAHSITLGLATFRILSPPASLVEPIIAMSIIVVGAHAFIGKRGQDPRMLFAFCFGLIHGFGFASVLQEMVLPREALGWSLFAFNAGVEIGQVCIVLAVAPVLSYLRRQNGRLADHVVSASSLLITLMGAFWFFQRVIG